MGYLRIALATALLGCPCVGQSPVEPLPKPEWEIYASFLLQVVDRDVNPGPINPGTPAALNRPSVQETLGLTAQEARRLSEAAAAYEEQSKAIGAVLAGLVFDIRMRMVADEEVPAALENRLRKAERDAKELAQTSQERIRTVLGDARFRDVDAYIRSKASSGGFFPIHSEVLATGPAPNRGAAQKRN